MRSRTIKPSFFKHEGLAEFPPLVRILFEGLWCLADCEGRLEDRPKFIKAEVLPYDDCDVEAALSLLGRPQKSGKSPFLIRYEVEGRRYIWLPGFKEHQRISGKEAGNKSVLPTYEPGSSREAPGKQPGNSGAEPGAPALLLYCSTALPLNPPDSIPPAPSEPTDVETAATVPTPDGQKKPREKKKSGLPAHIEALGDAWNEILETKLSRVTDRGLATLATRIDRRWQEQPSLGYWIKVFERIARSPLCLGEKTGWKADFAWVWGSNRDGAINHESVMAGKYDDRRNDGQAAHEPSAVRLARRMGIEPAEDRR